MIMMTIITIVTISMSIILIVAASLALRNIRAGDVVVGLSSSGQAACARE